VNWHELEWGILYGAAALSFWLVLFSAVRTKQFGGMTEKDNRTLFGLTMFIKGLFAMTFSLVALFELGLVVLPALGQ
jgi:hypothetical protein